MNETLQTIMTFINEHTLLLIGICVFLILVLIGYLIDNSVKSKRVRNDIKNKDQVPKNIKDEIIKEAEDKNIQKNEDFNIVSDNKVQMQAVDLNSKEVTPTVQPEPITINEPVAPQTDLTFENTEDNNTSLVFENKELSNLDLDTSKDTLIIETPNVEPIQQPVDPDANIMMPEVNKGYTNDKRLSEILFNSNYENTNVQVDNSNIFTQESNVVINNEINKNDVQIENNNSSDELDRIMRKLSTMNNNFEDDNYTNIF